MRPGGERESEQRCSEVLSATLQIEGSSLKHLKCNKALNVKVISGAAMTIIPTVIYCIMEGVIDAKSVKTVTDTISDAAEKLGANETTLDVIEQVGAVGEALVGEDAHEE